MFMFFFKKLETPKLESLVIFFRHSFSERISGAITVKGAANNRDAEVISEKMMNLLN
jgi:hypothetical protein